MNPEGRGIVVEVDQDDLVVTGPDILDGRQARLFFRGVLGARECEGGWRCPRRRTSMSNLIVRVDNWLEQRGYAVSRRGIVERTVQAELERRRSFVRTRSAADALRTGEWEFDFSQVDASLRAQGWSEARVLRPHQRAGVAHALTAINAANFSVPGSGKTVTALAAAVTHLHIGTVDLVVVVGPLACFDPWERETAAALGAALRTRRIRGTARQRSLIYQQVNRGELLLLGYATAAADLAVLEEIFEKRRVMLIVDESHRVKRFRGGVWATALLELARRARLRMILSGTPMPQSGKDLFSQLNVIWPDGQLTGTRDAFAARVDTDFSRVLREIHPFVSRTPKAALGLRPYRVRRHDIELTGTQAEVYELIASRLRRLVAISDPWRDKLESLRRGRPMRLLQAATNPDLLNSSDAYYRLPRLADQTPTLMERLARYREGETPAKSLAALEIVRSIAVTRGKVVCWSSFVANLDQFSELVRERLQLLCFQIDGRVPAGADSLHNDPLDRVEEASGADTREEIIHRFLALDGPAVLVANPASCSESISLHRSCHSAIYLDRTYDCAQYLQSIDRIHRLGLPENADVTVHILLATVGGQRTVDHMVDTSLTRKDARMRQLLEGAELVSLDLADDPAVDAEGDDWDLAALLRHLLGETPESGWIGATG